MNGTVERCALDVLLGIPDLLGWNSQNELAARYMQELAFVQCLVLLRAWKGYVSWLIVKTFASLTHLAAIMKRACVQKWATPQWT